MSRARGRSAEVELEGRLLKLTNLDKPFYPEAGWTKAHVIDYYRRIAPVLLPHLQGRAVTLKRYPDGVEGGHFYEKTCPTYRPEWLDTAPIFSESRGDNIDYCMINDLPSLVWAANLADLEIHTFLALADAPEAPRSIVFDLDPGPGTDLVDCCKVALRLKETMEDVGLSTFVKTSGKKGMQLYAPLNVEVTYGETKPLARAFGEVLERETPDLVTTNMAKSERQGRVLIDWSQNDFHKTTVCAYSLRATPLPSVSTPLLWDEVGQVASTGEAAAIRFLADEVLERVERHGDLFAPVLDLTQSLPALG